MTSAPFHDTHRLPVELVAHVEALCAADRSPFAEAFRATLDELDRADAITLHALRGQTPPTFDQQCEEVVERMGHDLVDDPAPFSQRKTCMTCGRAVLRASGALHIYGSAVTVRCVA